MYYNHIFLAGWFKELYMTVKVTLALTVQLSIKDSNLLFYLFQCEGHSVRTGYSHQLSEWATFEDTDQECKYLSLFSTWHSIYKFREITRHCYTLFLQPMV